jgi:Ca2+-binding RTX toxin-like protein
MSRFATRVVAVPAIALAALLVAAASAAACTYNETTRVVTKNASDGFDLQLDASTSGARIWSGVNPCASATKQASVTTTDTVVLNNATYEGIRIGYPSAPNAFAPGYTNEAGSSDEIEFVVSPAVGGMNFRIIGGEAGPDYGRIYIVLGGDQINMNANETDGVDADVAINGRMRNAARIKGTDFEAGFPSFFDDYVNASGGAGTAQASFQSPLAASGLAGDDILVGGSKRDSLRGGAGVDFLSGKGGDDVARGGDDGDNLYGYAGSDRLLGNAGGDTLNGGPGYDECVGGPGHDEFKDCELKEQ